MNNFSYKAFPLSSKLFHECSATTRGHGDDPVSLISHSALFSVISPPALNGLGLSKHKVVNESRWSLLSKPALLTDFSPATLASLLFQKHTGQTPHIEICSSFSSSWNAFPPDVCLPNSLTASFLVQTLLSERGQTPSLYLIIRFALSPSIPGLMTPLTLPDFSSFHNIYYHLTHFVPFKNISYLLTHCTFVLSLSPWNIRSVKTSFFVLFTDIF